MYSTNSPTNTFYTYTFEAHSWCSVSFGACMVLSSACSFPSIAFNFPMTFIYSCTAATCNGFLGGGGGSWKWGGVGGGVPIVANTPSSSTVELSRDVHSSTFSGNLLALFHLRGKKGRLSFSRCLAAYPFPPPPSSPHPHPVAPFALCVMAIGLRECIHAEHPSPCPISDFKQRG